MATVTAAPYHRYDKAITMAVSTGFVNTTAPLMEWATSPIAVSYPDAVDLMTERARHISLGLKSELVWLLEHPPCYTAGTSTRIADLLAPDRLPVYRSGRGGQLTYHGPGQRIVYVMLDVRKRSGDVRRFVADLERCIIEALGRLGVRGERRAGRVGIWVEHEKDGIARVDKIAAIGLRLQKWISLHGLSLNVAPELANFDGIVPCGIHDHGVTSLADLGIDVAMPDVDAALRVAFTENFGLSRPIEPPNLEPRA